MKLSPHPIPEDFCLTDKTRLWLRNTYPNIDEVGQEELFISKMSNAIDKDKRSPYYNQLVHAVNWQRKFMEFTRIAMTNKWAGSIVTKQGCEVDMRWQEVLTHAKAIGCPLQRRPHETADGFKTRVKMWEIHDKPRNVVQFELKQVMK